MQLVTQFAGADARLGARQIAQDGLALVVAGKTDVNVERTFHHKVATFHVDHRRAPRR